MYGLNPLITGENDPNSPFFVNHCEFCKRVQCRGCLLYAGDDVPDEDIEKENQQKMKG